MYSEKMTCTSEAFTKEYNLSRLSAGIYYMKIGYGAREIVKQIVITK
jgi:hypothetical protein